jgi:hypothetical protein
MSLKYRPLFFRPRGQAGATPFHRGMIRDARVYEVLLGGVSPEAEVRLLEPLEGVVGVALLEAEVPITYDVFRGARLEVVPVTEGVVGAAVMVSLADGTYTTQELAQAIQAGFDAAGGPVTLSVTRSDTTSLFTISRVDGDAGTHLIQSLVFSSSYSTPIVVPRVEQQLPARSVQFAAMHDGPPHLLVRSNLASGLLQRAHTLSPLEQQNSSVLARVQRSAGRGQLVTYINHFAERASVARSDKVSEVRLWVTFPEDVAPLDFKGHVWSARLRITAAGAPGMRGEMVLPPHQSTVQPHPQSPELSDDELSRLLAAAV